MNQTHGCSRAVWGRHQNYPFSASVSCEIGSGSPWPMCRDFTLSRLFSFNNSGNWSSVSSNPEIIPLAVSAQVQAYAGHSQLSQWECLWAKRRAEFGTSSSNFDQLNCIEKCIADPYTFLLQLRRSSSSCCFCEVVENKGLFVLSPVDYFLWAPSLFSFPGSVPFLQTQEN